MNEIRACCVSSWVSKVEKQAKELAGRRELLSRSCSVFSADAQAR